MTEERWVKMKDAAKLLGVNPSRISQLVARGVLRIKPHPLDKRIKLVDLSQIEKIRKELNQIETEGVSGDDDNVQG